eukprot:7920717-Alexandrium_andersonii.AAC.1
MRTSPAPVRHAGACRAEVAHPAAPPPWTPHPRPSRATGALRARCARERRRACRARLRARRGKR